MKIVEPSVILDDITPDVLKKLERLGRICYKSEHKITETSASEFVKKIMKKGHLGILEHAIATLVFVCDRGVTHELVRHRLASYLQESTRYCDYGGGDIGFIEPPGLNSDMEIEWRSSCHDDELRYNNLRDKGCSPQIARSVLPICVKTEIATTANFKQWLYIFSLRTTEKAHPQIRALMIEARALLAIECPVIFSKQ